MGLKPMIIGPRQNLFPQTSNTIQTLTGVAERGETGGNHLRLGRIDEKMDKGKCKFWVAKKRRFCANSPLDDSLFVLLSNFLFSVPQLLCCLLNANFYVHIPKLGFVGII